jgi:hypothetical protein
MIKREEKKFTVDQLNKLRANLPRGYQSILQKRILDKYEKEYPTQTIRRGLMFKFQNPIFIAEALILANEKVENERIMGERMQRLTFKNGIG